jgi:RNA polymerase sigma-70 factor (ECF subfamily)
MRRENGAVAGRTDEELLAGARTGDEEAFRELVRRLEPRVAATVIGMVGPGPDAEDIGQETFVRLYRALPKFRGESALASYVIRIAINLCKDERHRRKRRAQIFSDADADQISEVADPNQGEGARAERDLIRRAVQKLRPEYREVIVLRLMDGFSTRETAEILNAPEGTVTSRLARAQVQLRETLEPMLKEAS